MKRILPFLIVALVLAATITTGALLVRSKKEAALRQAAEIANQQAQGKPGAEPPHIRGADNAVLTMEEFADYQCPPCGNMSSVVEQFERDYAGKMRFIFRNLPHANHQFAFRAAYAAEAAGLQGKYWEMHDLLFRERFVWQKAPDVEKAFADYAASLALDVDLFKREMNGEKVKARVEADIERSKSLGFDATPTIFINGKIVPPTDLNPDALRRNIEAALQK